MEPLLAALTTEQKGVKPYFPLAIDRQQGERAFEGSLLKEQQRNSKVLCVVLQSKDNEVWTPYCV